MQRIKFNLNFCSYSNTVEVVLKLQQKTLNLVILEKKRFALHVIVRISISYLSYVDSVDIALAKNLQNMHYSIKIEVIRAVIYTCTHVCPNFL